MMPETSVVLSPLLWALVSAQMAMGLFDVLYHHELTERLAWRATASHELQLHAARNLFYAVLFLVFAWIEPHGLLAWAVLLILGCEVAITLADFVEEDMSRKLPATERVLHTLLALNYGAILSLIGPQLVAWAALPNGFRFVDYGFATWVLTFAAAGVLLFALRDRATSLRAAAFASPKPMSLAGLLDGRRSVLVTGGTGFIGSRLVATLVANGHDVTVHTRSLSKTALLATPVRIVTSLDQIGNDARIEAIVDLAGEPVADGLWTFKRRFNVIASRVRMLRDIERMMVRLETKPEVLIKASAIGRYGVRDDELLSEADAGGANATEFAVRSTALTEAAALAVGKQLGLRVVNVRIGLVLGRDGGMLSRLLPVFDLGLGGRLGSGQQWMSWIGLDDMVRVIAFAIGNRDVDGALNATTPMPVRNSEFTKSLALALRRPAMFAVPRFVLAWGAGDLGRELLLGGQRVVPAKLHALGFRFLTTKLEEVLAREIGSAADAATPAQSAESDVLMPTAAKTIGG